DGILITPYAAAVVERSDDIAVVVDGDRHWRHAAYLLPADSIREPPNAVAGKAHRQNGTGNPLFKHHQLRTIAAFQVHGVFPCRAWRTDHSLYAAAVGRLRAKFCHLIYSLARNTQDAIDLAERLNAAGANLAVIQENVNTRSPMGRFIFT